MKRFTTFLAALLVACWIAAPLAAQPTTFTSAAGGGVAPESVVMVMPMTTDSEEVRVAFLGGLYALDMQRPLDARVAFEQATELDPDFALAHLYLANTAPSFEGFLKGLEAAETAAAEASRAEQLMIEAARLQFDRNLEGALQRMNELTTIESDSPHAWLALANVQTALNQHEEARASIRKAIDLHSDMAAAHMAAGNSYLFGEPRDLDRARRHMERAVELAPNEPMPYDLLGDVHRASGDLEAARDAYTQAAERSPNDGSPYQQRAHVNSFLGDYDDARADYDRSMEMARENQAPAYGVYRALVSVHAGEPAAAVEELKTLADDIDEMAIPEPTGLKIFALQTALDIALHEGMVDEAAALLGRWKTLMHAQAELVGTDDFRRAQNATIEQAEARLAVARDDYDAAEEHATTMKKLVADDANPRKMEPVHAVLGEVALAQGNHAKAVEHLRQADPANDMRVKYMLAQALEGSGDEDEAMELYEDLASWYFNDPHIALIRPDVMAKTGM